MAYTADKRSSYDTWWHACAHGQASYEFKGQLPAKTMAERSPAQGRGETRVRSSLVSVITSGGIFRSQPYFSRARLILTQTTLDCALGDGQRTETVAECVHSYLLEDVVGVEVIDLPLSHSKTACQMNVHVYPKKTDRRNPKKSSRKMTVLSVCFDGGETHGENREDATRWKEAIKLHSYCRCQKVLHNPDSAGGCLSGTKL